jgi:hypothetical protein
MAFKGPKEYLINHPSLGMGDEENGFFVFSRHGITYRCLASNFMGWEHVSVSLSKKRCPTWEEMCVVKDLFWGPDDWVVQYHPQKSDYVNNHPYCLHLWRPINQELVRPPNILVGVKND